MIQPGDRIEIDIPKRSIRLDITDAELARRRKEMEARGDAAWKPAARERRVSRALQAYAALATSASRGAVRDLGAVQGKC